MSIPAVISLKVEDIKIRISFSERGSSGSNLFGDWFSLLVSRMAILVSFLSFAGDLFIFMGDLDIIGLEREGFACKRGLVVGANEGVECGTESVSESKLVNSCLFPILFFIFIYIISFFYTKNAKMKIEIRGCNGGRGVGASCAS